MYVKTVEMYVLSNCYETVNLGLFSKLLVLYVYIWLISAWDSRGNEKSQLRSVSKITQGYWFSFQFLLFLWFSCNSFYLTPLNWRNKFMHAAPSRIIFFSGGGKHLTHGTKTWTLFMNEISKSKWKLRYKHELISDQTYAVHIKNRCRLLMVYGTEYSSQKLFWTGNLKHAIDLR